MSSTMRGADIVARSLERLGCRRIFTLSGNHIMSLFDATLETKIKLVHVRHEAAAVHMADGWGRLTGEPGVAMVTGGPGHGMLLVPSLPHWPRSHRWCCCRDMLQRGSWDAAASRSSDRPKSPSP
jgi:glyoxylate carboligase